MKITPPWAEVKLRPPRLLDGVTVGLKLLVTVTLVIYGLNINFREVSIMTSFLVLRTSRFVVSILLSLLATSILISDSVTADRWKMSAGRDSQSSIFII